MSVDAGVSLSKDVLSKDLIYREMDFCVFILIYS